MFLRFDSLRAVTELFSLERKRALWPWQPCSSRLAFVSQGLWLAALLGEILAAPWTMPSDQTLKETLSLTQCAALSLEL